MRLGQLLVSRIAAATAVLLVGSLGAVAVSTPAQAAPECSKKEKFVAVTGVKTPWVITDIHRFHNGSGKSVKITLSTKKHKQLSSSRAVSGGGTITLKSAIKALEGTAKVNFNLVKKKGRTKSTTFTRVATVPAGRTILIYVARHQAKGKWTHYYCNGQKLSQLGRGTVKSYGTVVEDGLQRCDLKAEVSAAKKAKKQFC
jgi:hypothetical protein